MLDCGLLTGVGGLFRAVEFWRRVMPMVHEYQQLRKWREAQAASGRNAAQLEAEASRRAEVLHERYATNVLEVCLELRGLYLKLGQVCSTLPAVPLAYRRALRQLQDEVPCKPFAEVRAIVEASLGQPLGVLFSSFDSEPAGSASVGQVHRAVLVDGTPVAVKIQYPEARRHFEQDTQNVLNALTMLAPGDTSGHQFASTVLSELDFRREAAVMRRIGDGLAGPFGSAVAVPRPIEGMVTPEVLVMTWLPGVKLQAELDRLVLAAATALGCTIDELKERMRAVALAGGGEDGRSSAGRSERASRSERLFSRWQQLKLLFVFAKLYARSPAIRKLRRCLRLLVDVWAHQLLIIGVYSSDPHPGNLVCCYGGSTPPRPWSHRDSFLRPLKPASAFRASHHC